MARVFSRCVMPKTMEVKSANTTAALKLAEVQRHGPPPRSDRFQLTADAS